MLYIPAEFFLIDEMPIGTVKTPVTFKGLQYDIGAVRQPAGHKYIRSAAAPHQPHNAVELIHLIPVDKAHPGQAQFIHYGGRLMQSSRSGPSLQTLIAARGSRHSAFDIQTAIPGNLPEQIQTAE